MSRTKSTCLAWPCFCAVGLRLADLPAVQKAHLSLTSAFKLPLMNSPLVGSVELRQSVTSLHAVYQSLKESMLCN
jgi:hypothetical protein